MKLSVNDYKNQIRKSVSPSLLGAKKDEFKQNPETLFLKNIFNVSADRGQVGIVPTKVLTELPNQTFKTLITLMEKRDALEERKVRNFTVTKKSGTGSSNSSTPSSSSSGNNTPTSISTNSTTNHHAGKTNSTPTSPLPTNETSSQSVDTLQEGKRNRLFSIFTKNK